MTLVLNPPRPARQHLCPNPSAPAVVALLLSALALLGSVPAFAQAAILPPVAYFPSAVDSVVSKVNGPILDVLDGALQIDITNAKITLADDPSASTLPVTAILPGSRVVAQVTVPAAISTAIPPRLAATSVVVFLSNAGNLSGVIQGVSVAQGTFMLLDTTVKTDAATTWSGFKADGTAVKSLSDLSAGMQSNVAVTVDPSGVTAKNVFAYAIPTTRIISFRGKVDSEGATLWTIGGNVVQVTSETKIVGNPQVGDEVEVLEKVQILPPGSMAPTMLPVAISITKIVLTPPPTPGRSVEFDGVVTSLPPTAGPSSVPFGHWTISGKDVLVTPMTKVDPGIVQGSSVHVVGLTLPISILAPTATPQIVALQITKL
jgi:hypothetical protein